MLHGVGHLVGTVPWFSRGAGSVVHPRSWITGVISSQGFRVAAGGLLFGIAGVAFMLSGPALGGVIVPFEWWRPLTDTAAVVSMASMLLYWRALPPLPYKLLILALDLVIVGNWLHLWDWPI